MKATIKYITEESFGKERKLVIVDGVWSATKSKKTVEIGELDCSFNGRADSSFETCYSVIKYMGVSRYNINKIKKYLK